MQTEEAAKKEAYRIAQELNELCRLADFGVRALHLAMVANKQKISAFKTIETDILIIYAVGSGTNTLNALAALYKSLIIFVRKHSKPRDFVVSSPRLIIPRPMARSNDTIAQ